MNLKNGFFFTKFKNLNFKVINSKKNIKNNNFFYVKLISILIFFVIIILFKYKKKLIDQIILYIYKNYKKELIEKINSIEIKLNENKKILKKEFYIYNLLYPMEVYGLKKIRMGNKSDGGYILLDDFNNIKIAYSLGISQEISFDKDLADKNIDVFMYDNTINNLPFNNSRFHWKKIGVSGNNTHKQDMKTLSQLIKENGHSKEKNMILKFDIESNEWDMLENLPIDILNKFKYIVGEFHINPSKLLYYYNIFQKIQKTHQIFHLHCNNCGRIIDSYGYKICSLLEISLINKNGFKFYKNKNKFPIEGLDYKNCNDLEELTNILNFYVN